VVDGEKPGVDSRDEGKHMEGTMLFVEKMMWMDERVFWYRGTDGYTKADEYGKVWRQMRSGLKD